MAGVDEGGPDLQQGVTGVPGKAKKPQKFGNLCMGEALNSLQRGEEEEGEAEVRHLAGEHALKGDMHPGRCWGGRGRCRVNSPVQLPQPLLVP